MPEKPKFEEYLKQLEDVIQKLETGKLGLEESLEQYERGIGALKKCYEILAGVEKRVDLLVKDSKGNVKPEPFDTTRTADREQAERAKRQKRGEKESAPAKEDEDTAEGSTSDLPF